MFDRIEAALAAAGPYLLGAQFSAADLYLLMPPAGTRGMAHPARNGRRCGACAIASSGASAVKRVFTKERCGAVVLHPIAARSVQDDPSTASSVQKNSPGIGARTMREVPNHCTLTAS